MRMFVLSEIAVAGESIHDSDSVGMDLAVSSVSLFDARVVLYFITSLLHTRVQDLAMSAEAAHRTPMMSLGELVNRYRLLAGAFGKPVPLAAFQLPDAETERLFSGYDEDYHISRFFHFTQAGGSRFSINGIPATHVSLDAEIESIL